MEPFRSHRGSQTAIFLAGCILSCLLHLVLAEGNLTVVSVPKYPIQGQSVLLNPEIEEAFEQCEWTQPSGGKIILGRESQLTPTNSPTVLVVHRNCSLSIQNLVSLHTGRYTVKVTYPPAKQQEAKGPKILIGSIYLTFCDEKQIRISANPPSPQVGENAVLIPNGIPGKYDRCLWKQKTPSGVEQEFEDLGQEPNKQQSQKQRIKPGCSLYLLQLTQADSGNYSIHVEVFSDQNSAKERETRGQMKCYRSQMQLKVEKSVSGSASVKYSAGIIAGALLGSLTWTSSLSLVPLLFGMLSPSFPKC